MRGGENGYEGDSKSSYSPHSWLKSVETPLSLYGMANFSREFDRNAHLNLTTGRRIYAEVGQRFDS